jgi:hypothetical protein
MLMWVTVVDIKPDEMEGVSGDPPLVEEYSL